MCIWNKNFIIVDGEDCNIYIIDLNTKQIFKTIKGHESDILTIISNVPETEKILKELFVLEIFFEVAIGDIKGNIIETTSFGTSDPKITMLQVIDYLKKNLIVKNCIFWLIVPDEKNEIYRYIITTSKRGWKNFNIVGVWKKNWVLKKCLLILMLMGIFRGSFIWKCKKYKYILFIFMLVNE